MNKFDELLSNAKSNFNAVYLSLGLFFAIGVGFMLFMWGHDSKYMSLIFPIVGIWVAFINYREITNYNKLLDSIKTHVSSDPKVAIEGVKNWIIITEEKIEKAIITSKSFAVGRTARRMAKRDIRVSSKRLNNMKPIYNYLLETYKEL